MLDVISGWVGVLLFAAAVVLALVLDVLGQTVWAGAGEGDRRGRRARRWSLLLLALLVAAALAATVVRFYTYVY